MSRLSFAAIAPVWLASCLLCFAHDGEDHSQVTPEGVAGGMDDGWTSGDGSLRFEVLYTREHLPEQAQAVLEKLHGGFGVDRREGHGETYFSVPGAGIIRLSADLGKAEMIATDSEMRDANMHNATVWVGADGAAYVTYPGNAIGKVFT
ncbi:MAG: hypothetical protein ABGY41_06750, partial [Candidatus Poribacteria bacterium]